MRYLLWFWLMPLSLFWGWFGLSYYDVNFGLLMFSRQLHDLVFNIYGSMLGMDPAVIPVMFLKACIFDTFLIFGIVAFRKRKQIRAWWAKRNRQPEDDSAEAPRDGVAAQVPAE
jgi:hypothetical protein